MLWGVGPGMVSLLWAELAALALGTLGAALLFLEFFQTPSYVSYNEKRDRYRISVMSKELEQYTNLGRVGAFCLVVAFALLFVVRLLGG